jgi:hypothetical protein
VDVKEMLGQVRLLEMAKFELDEAFLGFSMGARDALERMRRPASEIARIADMLEHWEG